MMTGAKKKILITAIIAVAVVAAATLCFFIAMTVAFGNEAALCEYLDKNGVTKEELSLLVSGVESVADTFEGDDESYYNGAYALYALAVKAAENKETVEGAVKAYRDPPLLCNPFPMFGYSSVLKRLAAFNDKPIDGIQIGWGADASDSVAQILTICERIRAAGKENFDEAAKTLRAAMNAEDVDKEVSYKSLINLALYAVDVTQDADRFIADAVFGAGFSERYSDGVDSAAAVLKSADYDTLLSLSGYLPDTGSFAVAVCNYACSVSGFDKTAFCDAFAAAVNALYAKNGTEKRLDPEEVLANFDALAQADPDSLTERDKEEIKSAAGYFSSALSVLFKDGTGELKD